MIISSGLSKLMSLYIKIIAATIFQRLQTKLAFSISKLPEMMPKLTYSILGCLIYILIGVSSGHRSTLLSFLPCKRPNPPFEKVPRVLYDIKNYRKNGQILIRGNITVLEEFTGYLKFKAEIEKNGKITDRLVDYKGLSCKNLFCQLVLSAIKLQYDSDTCRVSKGNHEFKDLDVNHVYKTMSHVATKDSGIHIWHLSFYADNGTLFCADIRVQMIFEEQ